MQSIDDLMNVVMWHFLEILPGVQFFTWNVNLTSTQARKVKFRCNNKFGSVQFIQRTIHRLEYVFRTSYLTPKQKYFCVRVSRQVKWFFFMIRPGYVTSMFICTTSEIWRTFHFSFPLLRHARRLYSLNFTLIFSVYSYECFCILNMKECCNCFLVKRTFF